MRLQLLAIPLLVALMLSPLAAAAAGSITFSSPLTGASFSGTQAYTISGTITPTPTLPDNVFISVNQQGSSNVLDAQTVAVQTGGLFSYPTNVGGNSAWVSGTYVITATDSNGATGTMTFTYTGGVQTVSGGYLTVVAPSQVLTGATSANIFVWTSSPGTVTGWYLAPGATASTSLGSATRVPSAGVGGLDVYAFSVTLPATAATGVYLVGASVSNSTSLFSASNIGSFTVNPVATQTQVTALATTLTALQTSVTAIQTGLTALQTSVTAAQTSITGLQTSITGLQTSVTAVQTSIAAVGKNLTSTGSSLAAITTTLAAHTASLSAITSTLGTVNSNVAALSSAVSTLTGTVSTLSTTVNTISSTVSTISTSISSLSSSIQTLTSDVTGLQSTVNGLSGLSGQMTSLSSSVSSLSSSVSNEQTYILVVAALAVITLVLELAILIRKMS